MRKFVLLMSAVVVTGAFAVSTDTARLLAATSSRPDCGSLLGQVELEETLGTEVKLRGRIKPFRFFSAPGPGVPGEAAVGTTRGCAVDFDDVGAKTGGASLIAGFGETPRQWNAYRAYRKSRPYRESFRPLRLGRGSRAFVLKGPEAADPYQLFVLTRHDNVFFLSLLAAEGLPASSASVQAETTLAVTIMTKLDQQAAASPST